MNRRRRARGIGAIIVVSMFGTVLIGGHVHAGPPSVPFDPFPPLIDFEHTEVGSTKARLR